MGNDFPIITTTDISKAYGSGVVTWALRGVDFRVEPGEFVAIVGPSGSGKSTMLNVIGLLDKPTSGRIHIDGKDASAMDEAGMAALRAATQRQALDSS
jgi:ABC-type lipoprotein export system ATPase subunit